MSIKKGDKVRVDYEGSLDDGTVFDSSSHGDHSHPIEFEAGSCQVIKGFDSAVIGMKKGEKKGIVLKPVDAYGETDPMAIQKIPREHLPNGPEPKKGMMLALNTPDGRQFPATIKEVNEKEIVVDMNHPLAGKTLHFKIKIVGVND
ncbi:peptidylprolyl isomerase [Candidatus Woesearchaeota archaeon]|nr:peptidylprolyl isomerase [Candidatus Woesearchaeota archaeon]MBS3157254.1 peptidylprolyl isomerase [Candidatus Woesearchaeota archaeon]